MPSDCRICVSAASTLLGTDNCIPFVSSDLRHILNMTADEATSPSAAQEAEITYFRYQAGSWSRPRRVIVVRKKTDQGAQRSFWDEWGYSYCAYVTNLPWPAVDIYQFYNHRGTAENLVKESKYGFGIDCIPTGDFYPNWADLLLKLMAYNLFVIFQKALLPKAKGRLSAATLRRLFIAIPAQLVCRAGRWILKLPEAFQYQRVWHQARATFSTA